MNSLQPIYTEKNNCQDCYKCVKACPVKAIKIEDAAASIIPELCIYCGKCKEVCPQGAKKIRDDVPLVRKGLKRGEKIIVALAPSYLSEYSKEDVSKVIAAYKEAGFWGVSEVALGAEKVAADTKTWLDKQGSGVYFSSCCPSAVMLIKKYYPQYSSAIAPVLTPMLASAKYLKEIYPDCKVLFVGPCVAKKTELTGTNGQWVDYVLTFPDMKAMFDDMGIFFEFQKPTQDDVFIPVKGNRGNLYPIDGGMLTNMIEGMGDDTKRISANSQAQSNVKYMTFSGVDNLKDILKDLPSLQEAESKTFIEIMTCPGGCIKGPCSTAINSSATKRLKVLENITSAKRDLKMINALNNIDTLTSYDYIPNVQKKEYSQRDIYEAMRRVNKQSEKDELNCSGCGYDNCREFAKALIDGKAENDMCISFMRRVAQDKTNILLRKMPSSVVIVNDDLKIVDSNKKFADLFGEDIKMIWEANPGLHNADITKIVPFYKFFSSVLETGEDVLQQDIRDGDNYYSLSVFSVQTHSLVCGIIQNLHAPEVRKDLVLNRTKEVITQNMKVVQQIAFLLGENASYTESMLNSILESHNNANDKKDNAQ
jgi:Iron only hydrogenase large subunit, C-terminal domain